MKAKLNNILSHQEVLPLEKESNLLAARVKSINLPPMIYFEKSKVAISLWVLIAIGMFTGVLSGFIGVGGGIVMVPALIYLIGLPSLLAVGTGLFQFIFSAAFGTVRYSMSGNVIIFAAFIMILGSSIGTQLGALATRYVSGLSMRYVFAASVLIAVLGSILKLIDVISGGAIEWLQSGLIIVTFCGLGIIVILISSLFALTFWNRSSKIKCA